MAVGIHEAKDAVIDKQHVEVGGGGPRGAAQPGRRGTHGVLAEVPPNAPPGAFRPLHQSGHQSPLILRVSGVGRRPGEFDGVCPNVPVCYR